MDDVVINKAAIIERCIKRVDEEYQGNYDNLKNFTKQDSIILNIQRACEACIDLAMHLVSTRKMGIPQNSRDAFNILFENGIIDKELSIKLAAMVGFRNIAVHNYQEIDINIIKSIIENHLKDLIGFKEIVLKENR